MKPEYKKWRDEMLDTSSRFRSTSLFVETLNPIREGKYKPFFTTKDRDYTKDGVTYRSLKPIYMSYDHAVGAEYDFAMDVFGSWEHWLYLSTKSTLRGMIANWRTELEIKQKAEAIRTVLTLAKDGDRGLTAAKYILENGIKIDKRKAGRPSKEEVEGQARIAAGVRDTLEEDMLRLGLTVVKS